MAYSREIFLEAQKQIESRRMKAEHELDQRRAELYSREPRAEEIERELVRISVNAGRAVLSGKDKTSSLNALREKSLGLQKELADILDKNCFVPNFLEPWYTCEKCRDTGNIDGRMCECLKQLLRQTAYEQLNMISPLSLCSFESFSLEYYSKDETVMGGRSVYDYMSRVLNYCRRYADNFGEYSDSLLFTGGTGLGKTHLSLSIAGEAINKGYGVIYVSAPDILSRLESKQFGGRASERMDDERLLQECDLLILDDLGTEFITKFTQSAIYNIINSRLNSSKPVIISTNLTARELENIYGERMVSRIVGAVKRVDFYGTDIRQSRTRKK